MTENYSNLLNRQIKRFLDEKFLLSHDIQKFLNAVNKSYEHYEHDHFLSQRSLEISSNELTQLAMENADKEQRIRALIDIATDGVLVINDLFEIEMCNKAAEKLISDNEKKNCFIDLSKIQVLIFDNSFNVTKRTSLVYFLSIAKSDSLYEINIIHSDRSLQPVEISISKLILSNRVLIICMIRNISKRKTTEKRIYLRHHITTLLFQSVTLQDVAPKILSLLCLDLDWDISVLWLLNKEKFLKPVYINSKNNNQFSNFLDKTRQMTLCPAEGIIKNSWQMKKTTFIPDIFKIKDFIRKEEAKLSGLKDCLLIPIFYEENMFGIIELLSQKKHQKESELINILQDIGAEIGMFIERIQMRQRENKLQNLLMEAAKETGKMQVATSVLHNVGNILNSVNTSITILEESLLSSELNNLPKLANLMIEHKHDLTDFMTIDQKGKNLTNYIVALAKQWSEESSKYQKEIKLLNENVEHIKKIIKLQQSKGNHTEVVSINNILDELIGMNANEFKRNDIHIKREYEELPAVLADRTQLFQILINIIHNAIAALKFNPKDNRILIFHTHKNKQNMINIEITDNGSGIESENLHKIFNYGFTTKEEGHGFGLHSSAVLAKELGGSLKAESNGKNKGATFILSLPLDLNINNLKNCMVS